MSSSQAVAMVAEKVKELAELEERIEKGEKLLATLKSELRELKDRVLPDLFAQAELNYISYGDTEYSLSAFVNVSIPAGVKEDAFRWLAENGHGGIIKAVVKTSFPAGDDEAAKLYEDLRQRGLATELDQSIHAQTLARFGRECTEKGIELPEQFFQVYAGNTVKATKIKRNK